jgi:hypothetical protein
MGPWWIRIASLLLDYPVRGTIVGVGMMAAGLFGFFWTILEAGGVQGSPSLVAGIGSLALVIVATLTLIAQAFKWSLLYAAIKHYIRYTLWGRDLTSQTVLVGGSSGGGLAAGMVGKAVQELYGKAPRILVLDQDYAQDEFAPRTATLISVADLRVNVDSILYVTSYIGTGRSKEAMRLALGVEKLKTFAFVLDEAAVDRSMAEHFLVQGRRSIIPWPK